MTEQKPIALNKGDIDSLKSIFENSEIISDEDKKSLNQKREKSRKNSITLGEVFLFCFDTLSDYSYLFEDEENKDLRKRMEDYMLAFFDIIPSLRVLVEDYEEDDVCSYYDGARIKEYVTSRRERMGKLINLFFGVIMGEEE